MKVRKAIIPAAGLGTRFLPATKAIPKEMLPIIDKPTIQFILEEIVDSGIEQVLIITNKDKTAIENHFDQSSSLEQHLTQKGKWQMLQKVQHPAQLIDIHYVRQKEPKGLGHAILCAKTFVQDEPFAVLLGDTFFTAHSPCMKQMIGFFDQRQTSMVGVQVIPIERSIHYGMIQAERVSPACYRIGQLIEKPKPQDAPSNLAMVGRYILTPAIFDMITRLEAGVGGEFQLTDALAKLLDYEHVHACEISGNWHDVGDQWGYVQTMLAISLLRDDLKENVKTWIQEISRKLQMKNDD